VWATEDAQIQPEFGTVPANVEVCRRVSNSHTVFILINHGGQAARISLPSPMRDVLNGGLANTIKLDSQGIAVLSSETDKQR